jgi:hypothetical protein
LNLINLSCPGETTEGTIGHNVALGGGAGEEFNPCAYHNVDGFSMHTNYGPVSQLEAAIGAVTGPVPVKLVTINMGSNDELHMVAKCSSGVYDAEQGFNGLLECIAVEAGPGSHTYPGVGLFGHIIHNVGDVIGVLRAYGYTGPVGILGFYNPQAKLLPGSDALQKAFNEAFQGAVTGGALGAGVVYGNPFSKFNPKNVTTEGERICEYTEECNAFDKKVNLEEKLGHAVTAEEASHYPVGDIHATPLGYQRLGAVLAHALGI